MPLQNYTSEARLDKRPPSQVTPGNTKRPRLIAGSGPRVSTCTPDTPTAYHTDDRELEFGLGQCIPHRQPWGYPGDPFLDRDWVEVPETQLPATIAYFNDLGAFDLADHDDEIGIVRKLSVPNGNADAFQMQRAVVNLQSRLPLSPQTNVTNQVQSVGGPACATMSSTYAEIPDNFFDSDTDDFSVTGSEEAEMLRLIPRVLAPENGDIGHDVPATQPREPVSRSLSQTLPDMSTAPWEHQQNHAAPFAEPPFSVIGDLAVFATLSDEFDPALQHSPARAVSHSSAISMKGSEPSLLEPVDWNALTIQVPDRTSDVSQEYEDPDYDRQFVEELDHILENMHQVEGDSSNNSNNNVPEYSLLDPDDDSDEVSTPSENEPSSIRPRNRKERQPRQRFLTSRNLEKAAWARRRQRLKRPKKCPHVPTFDIIPQVSPSLPQKTAFRIRELIGMGESLTSTDANVMFELWARIHSSVRRNLECKQTFEIADLLDPIPPFMSGLLQG